MGKPNGQRGALLCGISLLLALGASEAKAFQEEPIAAPQNKSEVAAPAQNPVAVTPPAAQLIDPNAAAPSIGGTEVKIPGLGQVGVLPKLDFGLELLYGPQDGPASTTPLEPEVNEGDLQIKGTIKHRF
jgi:hypothetical protein